ERGAAGDPGDDGDHAAARVPLAARAAVPRVHAVHEHAQRAVMNLRVTHISALVATFAVAGALVAGCGNGSEGGTPCEIGCDRASACPDAVPIADCVASCTKDENLAKTKGCTATRDAVEECGNGIDICDANAFTAACSGKSDAYRTCLVDACNADPTGC